MKITIKDNEMNVIYNDYILPEPIISHPTIAFRYWEQGAPAVSLISLYGDGDISIMLSKNNDNIRFNLNDESNILWVEPQTS